MSGITIRSISYRTYAFTLGKFLFNTSFQW